MASRIEDEMELDATYGKGRRPELKRLEEWTPKNDGYGIQNRGCDGIGRHVWKGKASKTGKAKRMDASRRTPWRPKLRMRWKWTPRIEREGVQN